MATTAGTRHNFDELGARAFVTVWTLGNGDDGTPVEAPHYPDKTVQVYGTFGAGGTLLIEGTTATAAAGATWATLNDPNGNALSITAAKIEAVLENVWLIRPRVSAGDGTTSLTARILFSSSARR